MRPLFLTLLLLTQGLACGSPTRADSLATQVKTQRTEAAEGKPAKIAQPPAAPPMRLACNFANLLLRDNTRSRNELNASIAEAHKKNGISSILFRVTSALIISMIDNSHGRQAISEINNSIMGTKPSFMWILDGTGRFLARSDENEDENTDNVRDYDLVQGTLKGHKRDGVWLRDGVLYQVSGAPILAPDLKTVGASMIGYEIDRDFAATVAENVDDAGDIKQHNVNFYAWGTVVASGKTQIHTDDEAVAASLPPSTYGAICTDAMRIVIENRVYSVASSRMPGEAGAQGAFFSIFVEAK